MQIGPRVATGAPLGSYMATSTQLCVICCYLGIYFTSCSCEKVLGIASVAGGDCDFPLVLIMSRGCRMSIKGLCIIKRTALACY